MIDSGIDYTHPDLQGNIWVNHHEIPNNGIDDDKNGFIDDYYGWNFLSNSGDNMDNNYHGTHLSGMLVALRFTEYRPRSLRQHTCHRPHLRIISAAQWQPWPNVH